ncbi:MAG TPA: hypothetical protein VF692_07740 [Pyrinomonadaceae bacterium]|jgi:SOS-response transcriptional repressor LexA
MKREELKRGLIDTKDEQKIEYYEYQMPRPQGWYNHENSKSALFFEVYDDSLIDLGIRQGEFLEFYADCAISDAYGFIDERCRETKKANLFIVSLNGGSLVARFVQIVDDYQFILLAANKIIPSIAVFAEEIEIVGKVKNLVSAKRFIRKPFNFKND